MQIEKKYNIKAFKSILRGQRYAEDLVREILSKKCPLHGLKPDININQEWEISVSCCCQDFHSLLQKIVEDFILRSDPKII